MAERLKRIGTGTILLPNRPGIAQTAAIVGKKEGSGPLHGEFDAVIEDDLFGEETWEKAESRFHYTAADTCLKKAGATPESVDVTLGGDLLNQIMAASTAAQKLQNAVSGHLRRVFNDGGNAVHRRNALRRRICAARAVLCQQSLLFGGTAVPFPAGIRQSAAAHVAVDGHGRGRCAAGHIGAPPDLPRDTRHLGAHCRFGD